MVCMVFEHLYDMFVVYTVLCSSLFSLMTGKSDAGLKLAAARGLCLTHYSPVLLIYTS